jgi:hypothetical protein
LQAQGCTNKTDLSYQRQVCFLPFCGYLGTMTVLYGSSHFRKTSAEKAHSSRKPAAGAADFQPVAVFLLGGAPFLGNCVNVSADKAAVFFLRHVFVEALPARDAFH